MSEAVASGTTTAGALLRQMREAAGMDMAVLAGMLKVPVSKLQALENDDFATLKDVVFMRALANAVCRHFHEDAAAVLALLPQSQAPRLVSKSDGINATFKDTSVKNSSPLWVSPPSRNAALAVLVLLVGALLVYFVPSEVFDAWSVPAKAQDELHAPPSASTHEPAPAQEPVPEPVQPPAAAPAHADPAAGATLAVPAAPAPPAPPAPPAMPAPAVAPAAPPAAPATPQAALVPASLPVLEFRASAESWVQVRDTSGRVVFERVLKAGERAPVASAPPFNVVVGKAHVTEVLVRGERLDLAAVARDSVARFEVK